MAQDGVKVDVDHMIERARQQGITLDRVRAAALRPKVESLLSRLDKLGATLPRAASPPPIPPPRSER